MYSGRGEELPKARFVSQNLLRIDQKLEKLTNPKGAVTCIYDPHNERLTLLPSGISRSWLKKINRKHNESVTYIQDEKIFPRIYKKSVKFLRMLPDGKVILDFKRGHKNKASCFFQAHCIQCGEVILQTHTGPLQYLFIPQCQRCNDVPDAILAGSV